MLLKSNSIEMSLALEEHFYPELAIIAAINMVVGRYYLISVTINKRQFLIFNSLFPRDMAVILNGLFCNIY